MNQKQYYNLHKLFKMTDSKLTKLVPNPTQGIFLIFLIFTICYMTLVTYQFYLQIQISKSKSPEGYEHPKLEDFWITGVSALIFPVIGTQVKENLYVYFEPHCKVQNDPTERTLRSKKATNCVYKTLYFLFATTWGYIVLKD